MCLVRGEGSAPPGSQWDYHVLRRLGERLRPSAERWVSECDWGYFIAFLDPIFNAHLAQVLPCQPGLAKLHQNRALPSTSPDFTHFHPTSPNLTQAHWDLENASHNKTLGRPPVRPVLACWDRSPPKNRQRGAILPLVLPFQFSNNSPLLPAKGTVGCIVFYSPTSSAF